MSVMIGMSDEEKLWKNEYLQRSFSYLTEENMDWLEQHCEKTIRRTTGNTLKEHLMVLELIKDHKQYLSMRADYLRRMKASNEVLRKQGYISKDKIKDMMKYREFELQQEYKEFEEDVEWRTYKKILEEK